MTRLERAQEIACKPNQIERIDDILYKVKSQSSDIVYDVIISKVGNRCTCPDHVYRGVTCKHIISVQISQELRNVVEIHVIKEINVNVCPQCKCEQIVKHGIRHNKYGDVQRYSCLNCNLRFTNNIGFEKMRATPQIITTSMQLYFSGESLRNVQKFLRLQGINLSHVAVYKWINKYVSLMEKYLDTIKPNVSSVWRTDELYLKIKGDRKYLFAIMDDETRFWIAQQVSDKKNTSNVRPMFKQSIEITGKRPRVLISDGAHNFHLAYKSEYFTRKYPRTRHIRDVRFDGGIHNNNGTNERRS